jgi:integrase
VFPSEVGTPVNARNLDREFRRFIERAGVPRIPIHSVRHTVATLAVAAGDDVRTVADRLGDNTHVPTYAHVLAHRKAEVITTISELVLRGEPGPGADVLRTTPSDGIESSSDL